MCAPVITSWEGTQSLPYDMCMALNRSFLTEAKVLLGSVDAWISQDKRAHLNL